MGRKTPIFLIYENMLKSIAAARSECTAKQEIKTMPARTQTTLPRIRLTSLAMIEKISKRRLKKEILIIVEIIVLAKN